MLICPQNELEQSVNFPKLILNLRWLKMHIQLTNNNKKEIQLLFVSKLREVFKFEKRLNLGKIEQLYPTLLLLTFESSELYNV